MTNHIENLTLTQGEITLGRADENTITIRDNQVSHFHAKITTLFSASYIEDLDSTNGTFVNGKRVIKHTLHDGDNLLIGEQLFKIVKPNM